MTIVIAILASVVISLGVGIFFQNLNKEKDPMHKIKRFAEGQTVELQKNYKKIQDNFSLIVSEFKSQQDQANVAIKSFKQQNNEFDEKINSLQGNIAAVNNIQAKVDGYAKILGDLNNMTKQVEENLERIHKESGIVDNLKIRLNKQLQTVESIEKKIPEISKDFSTQNATQLKAIGVKLLDEYESYATNLAADIKQAKQEADAALSSIQQSIQSAYNQAATKAENLENTAFEHLSKNAEQRSAEYQKQIIDKTKLLETSLNNKFNDVENKSSEIFNDKIKALQEKYVKQLETLTGKNDSSYNELTEKFQNDYKKFTENYKKAFEVATAANNKKVNEFNQQFVEEHKKLLEEVTEAISSLNSETEEKIAAFTSDYYDRFENVSNTNNDKLIELNNFCATEFSKINSRIEELSNESAEKLNKLSANYNSQIDSASNVNDEKINELKAHYTAEYEKVNDFVSKLNEEIETKLTGIKAECSDIINNASTENANKVNELNSVYQGEYDKLKDRINQLDSIEAESKAKVDELRNGIEDSLKQFTNRSELLQTNIETMQNNLEDTISRVSSEAAKAIENAESSVQQIQEKCDLAISKTESIQPELDAKIQGVNTTLNDFQQQVKGKLGSYETEINGQFDGYQQEVNNKFDNFKTDVDSKLENLSKVISDSVKKAVTESEGKHLSILEDVDNQLNSYKKDIEYKLSQIQISDTDIDNLERSLKAAMGEVQNKLLSDFEGFKTTQKQKHDEFNQAMKDDADALQQKIALINESIDDLQATATGNMSSKLQEFETKFNQLLDTQNNKVDTDISEWKHNIDSKLSELTNTYEDSRKKVEADYLADLKSNVSSLQERSSDQYSQLNSAIEQTQSKMESSIADIQNIITKFKNDTATSINQISKVSEEEVQKEIDKNVELVTSSLARTQEDLMNDLKSFEETIQARQQTGSSNIDAALAEFNNWKQQFKTQLESSTELFNDEIDSFKNASQAKLNDVAQKLQQDMTAYANSIQDQHNSLNDQISTLENKTEQSIQAYEKRSDEILTQLNSMYEEMLTATEQKVRASNEDASAKIDSLRNNIQEISDKSKTIQTTLVLKMQDEANGLQSQFSELSKELSDIQANIQLYDKADRMKRELDEKLAKLENSFSRIQDFSDTAENLNEQYNSIVHINNDIAEQLTTFENQKNKVLSLEQQYNKMIALSNTIDERIQSLQTSKDDLQSMEVSVRNYNDNLLRISEQYERLEKKDQVVNRIKTDVDNQFEQLKDLEQRLINCNRQAVSLPQEIKEVQGNVDKILQNGPKITDAIGRLENLDSLIDETEKRIEALNSVQTGIKKTEFDLQGLSREVDNKFKVLHQMTKQNLAEKPAGKKEPSINPRTNESVRALKRQGWSISEIADNLNLTENEVDLILQLPE